MTSNDQRDPSSIVPHSRTDATRTCCTIVVEAFHVIFVAQSGDSHRYRRKGDSESPTESTKRQHIGKTWKIPINCCFFLPHSTCAHLHIPRCPSVAWGGNTLSCLSSFALLGRTCQHKRHMTRFIPVFFSSHLSALHRAGEFFLRPRRCSTSRNWIIGVNVCSLSLSGEARAELQHGAVSAGLKGW